MSGPSTEMLTRTLIRRRLVEATARAHGWEWPRELAERLIEILEEDEPRSDGRVK